MRAMQEGTKGAGPATLIVAALAGLVAGAMLMNFAGSHGAPTDSEAPAVGGQELARELKALTAELAELRASLGRSGLPAAADPASPQPLRADPSEAAALQALAEAVARLAAATSSRPAGSVAFDATPVVTPADAAAQKERFAKLLDQDKDARQREHLLWSQERVLQTYGTPDSIQTGDNSETWVWNLAAGKGHYLFIAFANGHVTMVQSN
jgi:hypothetical protein